MVTATGPDPRTKPNCDGEGGAEGIGGLGCVGHSFPLDFRRPHMAFQNQKSERGKRWVNPGEKEMRIVGL